MSQKSKPPQHKISDHAVLSENEVIPNSSSGGVSMKENLNYVELQLKRTGTAF